MWASEIKSSKLTFRSSISDDWFNALESSMEELQTFSSNFQAKLEEFHTKVLSISFKKGTLNFLQNVFTGAVGGLYNLFTDPPEIQVIYVYLNLRLLLEIDKPENYDACLEDLKIRFKDVLSNLLARGEGDMTVKKLLLNGLPAEIIYKYKLQKFTLNKYHEHVERLFDYIGTGTIAIPRGLLEYNSARFLTDTKYLKGCTAIIMSAKDGFVSLTVEPKSEKELEDSETVHVIDTKKKWDEVMANDRVIVKFTASWCNPCKNISPHYHKLSAIKPNVTFVEVDVDILKDVSAEHKIEAMPSFVMYEKGVEVDRMSGGNIKGLNDFVDKHTVD